jgi:putative ABC transport system permease protein
MTELWRDVRYGLRLLWKSVGFTSVSLLALALGIGATTAIFSLLYSVLLAPLPYVDGDRIVMVWSHRKGERNGTSPSDYLDWQKQAKSFVSLNAWTGEGFTISTPDWTEQVQARRVAPGFDLLMGEKVAYGRDYIAEDALPGNDHVVILNNRFWKERFGSDPSIVGKKLRMSGELYTVLGVAAPSPSDHGEEVMNVPLAFKPEEVSSREARFLLVMGRLKSGVTLEAANAEMAVIAKQLSQTYAKTNADLTVTVEPLKDDFLPASTRMGLWLMMGAVGFVLLIACVNIANLLLAWGTARQKEIAVRASQGATRVRIFRQFLIESVALAMMGGALGVLLSVGILRGVMSLMPRNQLGIPYEADPHLNIPVLLFTLAATMLCGVLFGCVPAWHAARQNISDLLKKGGRSSASAGHHRLRRVLVVAEFALALILVGGAGLILRSFWNVTQVDLGIRREHVLTFSVPIQNERTRKAEQIRAVYAQLMERISAVPGVLNVSVSPGLPMNGAGRLSFTIVGQPAEEDINKQPHAEANVVTPGYFATYGIRLTRGRYLDGRDLTGAPRVAMVSESFVRQYLPGVDPLTQRLRIVELVPDKTPPFGAPVEWQIVGVFHDVQYESHPTTGSAEVDMPFDQMPWPYTAIGVRTDGDPAAVTKSIAAAVRSVNPDFPMTHVRTMDQVVSESLVSDRFIVIVFGSFAGLALLLAAIGIYGVMTFSVVQRNHEMGIRMALGAGSAQVLRLVVSEAMWAALIGMAVGLPGIYLVGRSLKSLLYNVGAMDVRALTGVAVVLLASALVACYVPARRATKIDPMKALRQE